jgi:hypothetical protein
MVKEKRADMRDSEGEIESDREREFVKGKGGVINTLAKEYLL